MRRIVPRLLVVASLALAPVLAATADGADTSVGATFTPTASCGAATILVTGSPGDAYRVPSNGVITSMSYVPAAGVVTPVTFKVARAAGPSYSIVGTSAPVAVPGDAVQAKVRIPTLAGDILGIYSVGSCARTAPATYTYSFAFVDAPVGPIGAVSNSSGYQFDVSATLESDADGDGFGDVSQDLCPTDKNTQAKCGTGAPETTLSSLAAKKAKKANKKAAMTATFSASEASTFECAVDSAAFAPCASPFTAKLKVGTHSFAVRATDTAGNVDNTAAVRTFKIKVAKKK